jgi:hypothetical protein
MYSLVGFSRLGKRREQSRQ